MSKLSSQRNIIHGGRPSFGVRASHLADNSARVRVYAYNHPEQLNKLQLLKTLCEEITVKISLTDQNTEEQK
jgi:hypothetical protein